MGRGGRGGAYEDVSGDEVAAARAAVEEADEDQEQHDEGDAAEDEEDPEEPFVLDWGDRRRCGERGCHCCHGCCCFGFLRAGGVFVGDAIVVAGPPLGVGDVEVRAGHGGRRSMDSVHHVADDGDGELTEGETWQVAWQGGWRSSIVATAGHVRRSGRA